MTLTSARLCWVIRMACPLPSTQVLSTCTGPHGSLPGMEGSLLLTQTWILTSRTVLSRGRNMAPKTQQIHDIKRQLNSWELSPGEMELGGGPEVVSQSGEPGGLPSRWSLVPMGCREVGHRAGLGFSTKDDSVILPPTQIQSGDTCARHHWEGGLMASHG